MFSFRPSLAFFDRKERKEEEGNGNEDVNQRHELEKQKQKEKEEKDDDGEEDLSSVPSSKNYKRDNVEYKDFVGGHQFEEDSYFSPYTDLAWHSSGNNDIGDEESKGKDIDNGNNKLQTQDDSKSPMKSLYEIDLSSPPLNGKSKSKSKLRSKSKNRKGREDQRSLINEENISDTESQDDEHSESGSKTLLTSRSSSSSSSKKYSCLTWQNILKLILISIFGIIILLCFTVFPTKQSLLNASEWIQTQGFFGAVVFDIIMIFWIILCLPSTIIEITGGFLFGFWIGLLVNIIGKNIGCLIAFFIGRLAGKNFADWLFRKFKMLKIFERVVAKNSVKMVFLIRFAYIPIGIKNYGLSLLNVSTKLFVIATMLSHIPTAILFAFVGSSADNLIDIINGNYNGGTLGIVLIVVGAFSVAILMGLTVYYTRKEWKKVSGEILEEDRLRDLEENRGILDQEEVEMETDEGEDDEGEDEEDGFLYRKKKNQSQEDVDELSQF